MLDDHSKAPWWDIISKIGSIGGIGAAIIAFRLGLEWWKPKAEARRSADQLLIDKLFKRVDELEDAMDVLQKGFAVQLAANFAEAKRDRAEDRREVHHYRAEADRAFRLIFLMLEKGYRPKPEEMETRPYEPLPKPTSG